MAPQTPENSWKTYKKKEIIVRAIQWSPELKIKGIYKGKNEETGSTSRGIGKLGTRKIYPGDYILVYPDGRRGVCKKDIFEKIFFPVNSMPEGAPEDEDEYEKIYELPSGFAIYRRPNSVGGHQYFHDDIGCGVFAWDTCITPIEIMKKIVELEEKRNIKDQAES